MNMLSDIDKLLQEDLSLIDRINLMYDKMILIEEDIESAGKIGLEIIKLCKKVDKEDFNEELYQKNRKAYMVAARIDFDTYCMALEFDRNLEDQFYLPRRKVLIKHGMIQAYQDVIDGKLDFLCISQPKRTRSLVKHN